ncbi:hypothetical protein BDW22DRAFT_1429320 [Trametopsis cervina]|nr:hypothetical protein BDW22DRAFT_1429320 [Trametopsis cervina]
MAKTPLSPQARRLQVIIVTVPIIGATSFVLYQRLFEGKPRRTLPPRDDADQAHKRLVPIKPEDLN